MFTRDTLIAAYQAHQGAIARDSIAPELTANLTPAAVLIPIVTYPDGLRVLLTQRSERLKNHAGQISFPGGRFDPTDADLAHTALRETREEIGLGPEYIHLLGPIATYATITRFVITPYLALVEPGFDLVLQIDEVDEAFEAPLDYLLDPRHHLQHEIRFEDRVRHYHSIPWEGRNIWGATASMLRNLGRHIAPELYR